MKSSSLSPSPSPTVKGSAMVEVDIDQMIRTLQEPRKSSLFGTGSESRYENQSIADQQRPNGSLLADLQAATAESAVLNGGGGGEKEEEEEDPYRNQTVVDAARSQTRNSLESERESGISSMQSYENQEVAPLEADALPGGGSYTVPLSPSEVFTVPQHAVVGPRNYCAMDVTAVSAAFSPQGDEVRGQEDGNVVHAVHPDVQGYCDINIASKVATPPPSNGGSSSSVGAEEGGGGGGGGGGGETTMGTLWSPQGARATPPWERGPPFQVKEGPSR